MATTAAEVEQIVVRLSGDAKQYVRTMDDAQSTTKGLSDAVHKINRDVDGFGQTLSRFGHAAVAGYGLYQLRGFLRSAFDNFSEVEEITAKLTTTLQTNGRAVEQLTDQYKAFAEQQEELFITEDDHVLRLLTMAETYEITGTAAQKAVQDALALESATGASAEMMVRMTSAMQRGDMQQAMMFAQRIPQLRGVRDETEFLAKAQHLVASGMNAANAEMQTGRGILKLLERDYIKLLEEVGAVISEVVKPVANGLRQVVNAIRELDPDVKQLLASVTLVVAAFLSIGPAVASFRATGLPALRMMADGFQIVLLAIGYLFKPLTVLAGIWTGLGVVVATVFSGWGIAIAAAALLIGVFITRMGGVTKALEAVKDFAVAAWAMISEAAVTAWDYMMVKANEFIDWVTPIWRVFSQLATTAWQLTVQVAIAAWNAIKTAATAVGNWIAGVWEYITDGAVLNWDEIRKYIMMAIIGVEYGLLNFGKVAKLVWAGIKYGAVAMANFLIQNVFLTIFGPAGIAVALLRNLNIDWQATWNAIANFTGRVFSRLADMLRSYANYWYQVGVNIRRGLTTGQWNLPAIGEALQGIEVTFTGLNIPSLNRLEEQLRQEFLALGAAVGEDFQAFYLRRLSEIGITPQQVQQARRAGEQLGNAMSMGLGRPLDRLSGTLFGSMEAVSRIIEYQERFMNRQQTPTPRVEGEGAGILAPILRTIEEHTRRMAGRPAVRIGEADIG